MTYIFKPSRDGGANNPRKTPEKGTGPIPEGQYYIDVKDLSDPGYIGELKRHWLFSGGDWGDWRVKIRPDPENKAKGRDGFYLHGGSYFGSAGCIDIGDGLHGDTVTDFVRTELKRDPDGIIELEVFPSESVDCCAPKGGTL